MSDTLIFNGKSFAEFNVFFDGSKSFGTPEKDYEIISIPGRSGDLSIFNNRFKDIEITYPCFIRDNFVENFRNLTQYLNNVTGYQRLESSKEPGFFRKALFVGSVVPTTGSFNRSGRFDIKFRCNPQRWLKTGEQWIEYVPDSAVDNTKSIYNPTLQVAKPLIKMYGYGSITINHASTSVRSNSYDFIYIDCDILDAYTIVDGEVVNANDCVQGLSFSEIQPGINPITMMASGYEKIEIQPRWFEI